jgi:hypothetical protein
MPFEEARPRLKTPVEIQAEDLLNRFTYHGPKSEDQVQRYAAMRGEAGSLALKIVKGTPASREQSLAITKLEEAVFWANAAIARNE